MKIQTGIRYRRLCAAAVLYTLLFLPLTGCREEVVEKPEALPPAHLSSVPLSYADVVEHVAPAVVTVRSSKRISAPAQYPFFGDSFFGPLFGGSVAPQAPVEVERSLGSGVIVRADGHILTNHHVVDGAQEINVDLNDRRTYRAKLVGEDAPSDLAVLKIDTNNLPVLSLGNSDQVRVGDICLAVGNPLGVGQTVTSGIISAKGRRTGLSNGAFEDFLQTDAPINQGNSGGALVNTTGALIGINSQIISTTGGNIGLGFAIPSNMAKNVMDQLIGKGKVVRGHLGVSVQTLTTDLAKSLGVGSRQGVLVNSVETGGSADRAGLKAGDVITTLDGKKIVDPNSFRNEVAGTAPGTTVSLTVFRDGKEMQIRPTLSEASAGPPHASRGANGTPGTGNRLGLALQPLTPDIVSQLGLPAGTTGVVVTSVNPISPAADAGLQPGDVIVQINHQPIRSAGDVGPALEKAGSGTSLLLVNRRGQNFFVTVSAS